MNYQSTIGLEVHAELKTRTKMFCDSLNDPDEKHPNRNVCPVCLAHPGTLPTINKKAVEAVINVGLALNGKINPVSKFDRKNYFYPDLPKGYQISQYDQPLVVGGELLGIRLTRIHLEEDTGTLAHSAPSADKHGLNADQRGKFLRESASSQRESASFVDFNRAGVPLMELVTEPDIHDAETAVKFGKELRLILRYLGVSDANMEKGQMRLEANISLREIADLRGIDADQRGNGQRESALLGTKVEVKNINSFKALGAAIKYEVERQKDVLEKGEQVVQETRGWDDAAQKTFSQRLKEEAHDYRYFPEPDLPPFEPAKVFDLEDLKRHLPELPAQKRERFEKEFGLNGKQAALLTDDKELADFFEQAYSELAARDEKTTSNIGKDPRNLLFNYLATDLIGIMRASGVFSFDQIKMLPGNLSRLVDLIADGKIGSRQAKDILKKMFDTGRDPEEILESESLHTISGEEDLKQIVLEVLTENQGAADDFKKGKAASIQFLIGRAMAKLRGRGDPEVIRSMLLEELTR